MPQSQTQAGPDLPRSDAEPLQLVTFRVAADEYAVDILSLKEITRMARLTPVPNVAAFVHGVMNLRGQVVPVVDMRQRFDLPETTTSEQTRIIIVKMGERLTGIVVDSVTEVLDIARGQVEPPPAVLAGLKGKFLRGIVKLGQRLIILLDLEPVLESQEPIRLQRRAPPAPPPSPDPQEAP